MNPTYLRNATLELIALVKSGVEFPDAVETIRKRSGYPVDTLRAAYDSHNRQGA